ncbi:MULTISPECIES: FadR/GntR family transcriptional regulator [Thalassospira]|jgi:DNA-binding FadR family transcriptional regulator|uniref:GntR family transcriptional regulator n=2 Tax=Thalassospira TaxID=168934 RepID=A0A367WB95_9PROT|nr:MULTISPECIES: FadR/GntR family transcriptional regulator [Thalassospira]MDG4718021.1 FadR/GntR family transcriptional regulator [Thalassospira sp. FZY0004]RCK37802.1 GntR family transcriptional regulator [Thalassospira profundimaris]
MKKPSVKNTPRKVSLTEKVIASLRAEIESGQREPGSKLPTEPVLTERFGVSRTVVREAIAALKADGLLEPRQGAGVFVLAPEARSSDKSLFEVDYAQVSDVLEILELRMAVEIEAAGLACTRSSVAQQAKIFEAMEKMEQAIEKGEPTSQGDFEFHSAIAAATNNRRFVEFLEHLGDKTIPRAQLRRRPPEVEDQKSYMQMLMGEHRRIYDAIATRDGEGARQAMRDHLSLSQTRYQKLLTQR